MGCFHLPNSTELAQVHFRTADLDRALHFYRRLLGFEVIEQNDAGAELSATGEPPALIRFTWDPEANTRDPQANGLSHVGIRFPARAALARAVRELVRAH